MKATTHCVLLFLLGLAQGCGATTKTPVTASSVNIRTDLVVIDGRTGDHMTWGAALSRMRGADIIVVGEQHNDATGHAAQLAITEDVLTGGHGALSMEMLERDEQILVEDYRDGVIDAKTFASLTNSTDWSGTGSWAAWYHPVVDAAIERDAAVIAANAPRRYVKRARSVGWESIDALDATRRDFVSHPDTLSTGPYRDRFFDLMGGHDPDGGADVELIESFFRAQQVWDATMARSTVDALGAYGSPVILLIGRFHSDHGGGTVEQIKRRAPAARVVIISLEPACDEVVTNTSLPQADLIMCTKPLR